MNHYARHIHLDFHTSELLQVGDRFDPKDFADTLRGAAVNSIVVFAKCHHGWCYYPTKLGHMHPQLTHDLMGEQIKACREAGIRVIAYITGAWSASDALRHPEWQCISFATHKPMFALSGAETDRLPGPPDSPKPKTNWPHLCLAGDYGEHVKALAREVLDSYDVDGLFFDIMGLNFPCVCPHCSNDMTAKGYDPEDRDSALSYMSRERQRLMDELRGIVRAKGESLSVFFNSGGANIDQPEYMDYSTHYEMENLSSKSSLGYDGIVNRSKYFRETGKAVWGMTGKFHTSWGEFGGFKHPDALVQECAAMLAYGVRCNIGDHLHPSGAIDHATYELIGRAFRYVERLEEYIDCGKTVSRLGMLLSEQKETREGMAKLLSDAHLDYRVLTVPAALDEVDCLLLAAPLTLSPAWEEAVCSFLDRGGRLALFGRPAGAERLMDKIGWKDLGPSELDQDLIRYTGEDRDGLPDAPILMYTPAHRFAMEGETLAEVYEVYFSRTEAHYCSHRNAPNRPEAASYPAILLRGNILCFAHNFGAQYFNYGSYWCRALFVRALRRIYTPELTVEGLPVWGRYTLYRREHDRLLHLLGLQPIKRGSISVLEEPSTICDLTLRISGPAPRRILCRPGGEELPFTEEENGIRFVLPKLKGHQLLVLED